MSVPDSPRAGAPTWRSLSSALARPRLFSALDRSTPLTVLDAPRGYGKRMLVASWLHHGGAPDRTIVWVPPIPEHSSHDVLWTAVLRVLDEHPGIPSTGDAHDEPFVRVACALDRLGTPALLILSGVGSAAATGTLTAVLQLLDRCPLLDAIVCLPGSSIDMTEIVERGIACTYIPAPEIAFTVAETISLLRTAGHERSEAECEALAQVLSGVPVLISAAASLAHNIPQRLIDTRGLPTAPLRHVVRRYCEARLDELDAAHREFALSVVAAHSVTVSEAAELTGTPDPAAALHMLTATGLLVVTPFDGPRTWRWPDAVRSAVLEISREARPGHVDELLNSLALARRADGHPAEASIYAVEAGDWATASEIVEESWVDMVAGHFDVLVKVLRQIPDEAVDDRPSVQAGRALFTQMLDEHAILHSTLPGERDELAELGRSPGAAQTLYVATIQSLALRVAGELGEAARLTRQLWPLVRSMIEHRPDDIGPQLPLLRAQWGITLQLAGYLDDSNTLFRRAHRGAGAAGLAFVVQNAAGNSALNWAVSGDNPRAREWLRAESRAEPTEGRWGEIVRVGGRSASVLVHLDELDLEAARVLLDELGVPRVSEELWGFIAYSRAYYDLATGNAYDGLTALHRMIASHYDRHSHGAFSQVLLGAAEVDLQLALGNGNLARALADEGPGDHPLLVVTSARVELLTGHPDAALKKVRSVPWAECGFSRAHLEALLIDACARLDLGDHETARRNWQRACTLSTSIGNCRALTTLPPGARARFEELAGEPVPYGPIESVFTEPVTRVELSRRETDVLELLALGTTHADIARKLFVSPNTIKTQLRSIYRKLGAHTRGEAVGRARELKLLPVNRTH